MNAHKLITALLEDDGAPAAPDNREQALQMAKRRYYVQKQQQGVPADQIEAEWLRRLPAFQKVIDDEHAGGRLHGFGSKATATAPDPREHALQTAKTRFYRQKQQQGVPADQIEAGWLQKLPAIQQHLDAEHAGGRLRR